MKLLRLLLFVVCTSIFCLSSALADPISITFTGDGLNNGGSATDTYDSTNDHTDVTKVYGEVADILMEVTVDASGDYKFVESITNETGYTWLDFNWELLVLDDNDTNWIPSSDNDGLSFSDDVAYNSNDFTTLDYSSDALKLWGGELKDSDQLGITYTVTVPDNITTFAVRQYDLAQVPAPSGGVALVSLFLAVGGTVLVRRRRK